MHKIQKHCAFWFQREDVLIINVGYHLTLLHTKYTGFMPCGFSEEYLYAFSYYKPISVWMA